MYDEIDCAGNAGRVTGHVRADHEREFRISTLVNLICAASATPFWRRVCYCETSEQTAGRL